jgi:Na+/melibiose symporter-like transporter
MERTADNVINIKIPERGLMITAGEQRIYSTGTLRYTSTGLTWLFVWLLWGDFCANMMETVIPNVLPLKFKSLSCSATVISFMLTGVPSLVMLFWNPVIATWSDRYRSRWGRRIPFLMGGMPFMVLVLIGMGFCDYLGQALFHLLGGWLSVSAATTSVLAILLLGFYMCNSFVWSPYWALFNDTVPREVLGRFSMLFRIVSTCAVAAFNFLIFPHAETHYRLVFVGVAILFAAAYIVMCFNVKEGDYPPPTPLGHAGCGFLKKVQGYFRESFGHPLYVWLCLGAAFTVVGSAAAPFILLMNISLGLDLKQIGWINGSAALITLPAFFVAGLFVDRWNVVKLCYYGRVLQTLVCAGFLIYLFVDLSPKQVLVVTVVLNLALLVITAFMLVASLPMSMRLFPSANYGQFSSAVSVAVGATGIIAGLLVGGFLDLLRWVHHGSDFYFRYAPLWLTFFFGISGFCQYKVYHHVKKICGDDISSFVPPTASKKASCPAD